MEITRTKTTAAMIEDFDPSVAQFCIDNNIPVEVYYTDTVIEFHPEFEIRVRLVVPRPVQDDEGEMQVTDEMQERLDALLGTDTRYELKDDPYGSAERWYIDTDDDNVDDLATELTERTQEAFPGLQIEYKGYD